MTARPRILAIDPGTTHSGVVLLDLDIPSGPVVYAAKEPNDAILRTLARRAIAHHDGPHDLSRNHALVVEFPKPRGMPASADLFRTVWWIGRFREAWGLDYAEVDRHRVKIAICHNGAAKDSNIRAALIDRFGGAAVALARQAKCAACRGTGQRGVGRGAKRVMSDCAGCGATGRVGADGPLRGATADCWSALAVGLTYAESARPAADAMEVGA